MIFSSWFKSTHHESFEKELLSTNLVRAKTISELFAAERKITSVRQEKLQKYPLKGDFDYKHLQSIHRELFQDIYVWAGHDRYSTGYRDLFKKGDTEFVRGSNLPDEIEKLFKLLKNENYFKNISKKEFIEELSSFFNNLNILHPFMEGNGRTQRLFIEDLAKNAGYKLNLSKVSQENMIKASIEGAKGNINSFKTIFEENLISKMPNPVKINSNLSFPSPKGSIEHPSPFLDPFDPYSKR